MGTEKNRAVIENSWKKALDQEFESNYMQKLRDFLLAAKRSRKVIYPPGSEIFKAFDLCPVPKVRAVILGQDPYHGPNQAHGLSFSVKSGVQIPPSLVNIFAEIQNDLGEGIRTDDTVDMVSSKFPSNRGCLTPWAKQGVLLLNSILTVERAKAGSHRGKGWELFTDKVISYLNEGKDNIVFMLWGSYAQTKGKMIDRNRHLVLEAPHPSPLSAHRGFFGCRHFSRANEYLVHKNIDPINWFDVE